jgi:hypothetical protein
MKKLQEVKGISEQKAEKMRAAAKKLDTQQGFHTVGGARCQRGSRS